MRAVKKKMKKSERNARLWKKATQMKQGVVLDCGNFAITSYGRQGFACRKCCKSRGQLCGQKYSMNVEFYLSHYC